MLCPDYWMAQEPSTRLWARGKISSGKMWSPGEWYENMQDNVYQNHLQNELEANSDESEEEASGAPLETPGPQITEVCSSDEEALNVMESWEEKETAAGRKIDWEKTSKLYERRRLEKKTQDYLVSAVKLENEGQHGQSRLYAEQALLLGKERDACEPTEFPDFDEHLQAEHPHLIMQPQTKKMPWKEAAKDAAASSWEKKS